MDTKRCTHCGEVKPLSEFRHYYDRSTGYYRYCKTCEKIMIRRRYLVGKGDKISESERLELAKIEKLYDLREACGLEAPGRRRKDYGGATALVDKLLEEALKNHNEATQQ